MTYTYVFSPNLKQIFIFLLKISDFLFVLSYFRQIAISSYLNRHTDLAKEDYTSVQKQANNENQIEIKIKIQNIDIVRL